MSDPASAERFAGAILLAMTMFGFLRLARVFMRVNPKLVWASVIIALWLGLTAYLAGSGFLKDFTSMPPRVPVLVVIQFAALIWFVFFSKWRHDLEEAPQVLLIGLQFFRLPVEIALGFLADAGRLPVEMSFHGRNFDIVTGVTALLMAYYVNRRGEIPARKAVIAWNIVGLLLVTNVVVHGMLSVPYPFKFLNLSVDNTAILDWPAIWLPMFLVPMAYFLHAVSLRRALKTPEPAQA